jgi:hypothetical protein
MRSYPNLIPLPAETVRRIAAAVEPFAFDRIYGAWFDRVVSSDGKAAVARSAQRYIGWIQGAAKPSSAASTSRGSVRRL